MSATSPRRPRRLLAACRRCHSHKIKCSGKRPCEACVSCNESALCSFPAKERKVPVPESYLRKLKEDSQRLQVLLAKYPTPETLAKTPKLDSDNGDEDDEDGPSSLSPEERNMPNPLFDGQSQPPSPSSHQPASQPDFIGEASCAAFGNRLLQCLDSSCIPSPAGFPNHYRVRPPDRHAPFDPSGLPGRMEAKLLLHVAQRFIGNYHPLFLAVSFMREVDAVYRGEVAPSTLWLCKLYALVCLGEVYTNRRGVGDNRVPGTDYYIRAVSMLPEAYEEPSLLQVEVLTLLAWASNVFGRVQTAFCYAGTAMRLAMSMGMHRSAAGLASLTPVERECRRRTWWVLYFFERFSASKLGQPVALRDEDMDVELPSMDGLTEEEQAEFLDPLPSVTNIELARIIGNILTDIYGIPRSNGELSLQRVHGILKQLRAWHDELRPEMRLMDRGAPRTVASLHLAYHQCIIQTTRPVLLHLFKAQFHLSAARSRTMAPQSRKQQQQQQQQDPSSIMVALADSCVGAAHASSRIAEALFLDGSLATFGYWDAHHFFSAALILVMSAVMKPAAATSDALETLLSILRSMNKDGNVPAADFCRRLSDIQSRVAALRGAAPGSRNDDDALGDTPAAQSGFPGAAVYFDGPGLDSGHVQTQHMGVGTHHGGQGASPDYSSQDILGNSLIGSFLDAGQAPWPDFLFLDDGTIQDCAPGMEDDSFIQSRWVACERKMRNCW